MDERVKELYLSFENGAAFQARIDDAYLNLSLSDDAIVADRLELPSEPDPAKGKPRECPECGHVGKLRRGLFGWECRYCATEQG